MSIKKKVLNSEWIVILLLLAFFPPAYLNQNAMLDHVLDALKLFGFLLIFCFYLTDIRKHIQKPFNILLIALWAELFIATLISEEASLYAYLTQAITVFSVCFLTEEIAIHNPYVGLKSMYIYFSVCVLINTLTVFIYPNAMYADVGGYRCWFLGDDNTGYSYYIVASTLAMAYCASKKEKFTIISLCVWVSGYIFAFGREIGSGRICQILWGLLFLIYHFNWIKNSIKARYILYVAVGGFLVLVIFRSAVIEPIALAVGKSVTLTGRTIVWDNLLKAIAQRPLLGFGVSSSEEFAKIVHTSIWGAHNYILQILFWGGICGGVLFALLIFFACKGPKEIFKSDYCRCIIIGLIIVLVRLLVENGASSHFDFLLTMLAYSAETVPDLQRDILKKKIVIRLPRAVTINART